MPELASEETFEIKKRFTEWGMWEVTLKKHWTAGDAEAVEDDVLRVNFAVSSVDNNVHLEEISMRVGRVATAFQIIKGWNATKNGELAEITKDNIRALPSDVFDWILETWEAETAKKGQGRRSRKN